MSRDWEGRGSVRTMRVEPRVERVAGWEKEEGEKKVGA